jgi:PIN domain nuclease of toxin-antitoxin system
MRILLDTHVYLWAVTDSPRLSAAMRECIGHAEAVFLSAASVWEIAIKVRLGKLQADIDALVAAVEASGFQHLPVTARHAAGVARLPPLHADPFDRLLLAQAIDEPLRLLTVDGRLADYGPMVMRL